MAAETLTIEKILRARENLKGIIHYTPCVSSKTFSRICGNQVYLKTENQQRTGSFKIRGAYNKIVNLSDEEKQRGVIAASAGNHAQGVALGATAYGIQSTIVMPEATPIAKVSATREYGAEVVLHGANYDEAYQKAMELQKESGATFIHPFDDYDVMAGQATIGLEILEQISPVDIVIAPVGGGGLLAGLAMAIKSINPNVKVIGVEAETSNSMQVSIQRKEVSTISIRNTIADGIAVKTPGSLTYDLISKYVDEIVTVSEAEIANAILMLLERTKMMVEGAGAVGVAALLHNKISVKNKKIVPVVSGGNIDTHMLAKIIHKGLVKAGRIAHLTMILQDRPGELLKIADIMYRHRANVVSISHDREKSDVQLGFAKAELSIETQNHEHIAAVVKELIDRGYNVELE